MPHVSFASLVVVAAIAVAAPLLVGLFPRIRVPAVVLEIVAGIVLGPHGLKLIKRVDEPVQMLTLFFSGEHSTGTAAKAVLLVGFALLAVAAALALGRLNRSMRFGEVLIKLQDTTAEIRVRIAVLLLIAFVAMAERFGLETILGAFIAGGILSLIDRDSSTHPHFRLKLEAIGYGFVVPVFFVTSGLRFDLGALLHSPSAFA